MSRQQRIRLLLLILVFESELASALYFKAAPPAAVNLLPSAARLLPEAQQSLIWKSFTFAEPQSLAQWEEKVFKGKTWYRIVQEGGARFLRATSRNAASGLYLKLTRQATPDLWLSWRWRARQFPKKTDPTGPPSRNQDDYAARLYVIFPASNFFKSDVIEYIWDDRLPEDSFRDSPFSERVKLFVVQNGPGEEPEGWTLERRNVYEDYVRLFGKPPKHDIGALAIMSDADNTETSAECDFQEITLLIQPKKGGQKPT